MMPTPEELRREEVWSDQFVPSNLRVLVEQLEWHFFPDATNIGAYGDYRHLRGYHRSRNWILHSRYCNNRTYSVVETEGNRSGGNGNWISGVDLKLGYSESLAVWERINLARQNGLIPYVRQNLLERDPWHVHLSLDRAYADADHSTLFAVIIGVTPPEGTDVELNLKMPTLRRGAEGGNTVTAQGLLCARGFATALDGNFGPDTEEKTKAMQSHYGAESVDGIWGPETWTIAITGEDRR